MRHLVLLAAALLVSAAASAHPSAYPVHIERQKGSTLVIEHTPLAAAARVKAIRLRAGVVRKRKVRRSKAAVRRSVQVERIAVANEFVRDPAIAGGCRDGGFVRRVGAAGQGLVLHREVCEGIAPVSSLRLGRPGVEGPLVASRVGRAGALRAHMGPAGSAPSY